MIVYNKNPAPTKNPNISLRVSKGDRQLSAIKKISKSNKEFLRALGLKIK